MFFIYFLLWLIFSMRINAEILVIGIIISAGIYWFAYSYMRYKPITDGKLLRKLFLYLQYVYLLIRESAKANMAVFRIVFSRKINIEQHIIFFRTKLKTHAAQVALANSITLAPGSVTVSLEDGLFCVHFLDSEFAEGIEDSAFIRQLQKIEE